MGILIKNVTAVLPDGVEKGVSICIEGDKIAAVGAVPAGFAAERVIDGAGKLLIPGLINAHTHAYMTVFRNYADDLLFNDWLFGKILPLEDQLTPEDCYWGTLLACMEMLSTGTTCFNDMYIFTEAAAKAVSECGMRAVMSRGLTGGADDVAGGERRLREARAELDNWQGKARLSFRLAPHAPYTCDPDYQRTVAQKAAEWGVGIHTHVSESLSEIEGIREKHGCTPVELMDSTGLIGANTVAAHCVQLTDGDIEIFAKRGAHVATNPVSNLKLANGIAPIPKLLQAGVNVCLGTDGTASNNTLNMIREMGYLALLHKGVNHDAKAVSAREALDIATRNGAKALGLEDVTGQIREGLQADLVLVDLTRVNMQPNNDPVAALAYSANGSEVVMTMVAGKLLYEDGKFNTIDREKVLEEVEKICARIGMR